jgi:hypothetical protein
MAHCSPAKGSEGHEEKGMISGAHSIIYSSNPDKDRGFLRDVLGLPNVDVGDGWLIFGLPPSEVAIHPSDSNDVHELFLMCDDVQAFVKAMKQRKIACDKPIDRGWGVLTTLTLPGGGKLGVYEPRHARPKATGAPKRAKAAPAAAPKRAPKAAARPKPKAAPGAKKKQSRSAR